MKTKHYFLLYLLIFFLVNVYLINFTKENYYWDEVVYLQLAKNLNQKESYNAYIEEGFRPVLLPAILSFTQNSFIQHLIMVIISLLVLYLFYKLLNYFFSEKISLLSIISISTLYLYLFWTSKIMTESPSMLLITLSLFFYFKFKQTNNEINVYLAIFSSSLSTLSKPLNLAFTLPFLMYILIENIKLITKIKLLKAFFAFIIPLIPVFIQGVLYYGHPLGALIFQSQITIEAKDYLFYLRHFFKIFLFTSPFIILGLMNYRKKLKLFLITLIINFIILQLVFSHNVQERFLLPLFPLILPFIASGIELIIKKYSSIILLIIFLLMLPVSISIILNDKANTKLLIDSSKELSNLPDSKIYCNSQPYCAYFGKKDNSLFFPKTKEEFLTNLKDNSIKYIFMDNYHGEPEYRDFIDKTFKPISLHQNAYKYARIYSTEWKEN